MATSTDWIVRQRPACGPVLYGPAPLATRYETICKELEPLRNGYSLFAVRQELESMARSAADDREAPFLDVGKNLLTYWDQELYREVEAGGEDPRLDHRLAPP
jgi:hypothetical protein